MQSRVILEIIITCGIIISGRWCYMKSFINREEELASLEREYIDSDTLLL